jgi:hypothetical protein
LSCSTFASAARVASKACLLANCVTPPRPILLAATAPARVRLCLSKEEG